MGGGASDPPCWLAENGIYNGGEWERWQLSFNYYSCIVSYFGSARYLIERVKSRLSNHVFYDLC